MVYRGDEVSMWSGASTWKLRPRRDVSKPEEAASKAVISDLGIKVA